MMNLIQTDGAEMMRQASPWPDRGYLESLLQLAGRWKQQPDLHLPGGGKRSREVSKWIRQLAAENNRLRQDLADLASQPPSLANLESQLAKSEQEVRSISLEGDRWRRRANEAEALVRSSGLSAPRSAKSNTSTLPGNRQQ
jgi:hypothetical protein